MEQVNNSNTKTLAKPKRLCYNGLMQKKVILSSAGLFAVAAMATPFFFNSNLVSATGECEGTCENTNFQVNVAETLTVSVNTPNTSASGTATANGTFLRNKISVSVNSNNAQGFKVSMYSKDTTNLVNTSNSAYTIPTLASSVARSSFTTNHWGYSVNDDDSNNGTGSTSSTYSAMQTSSSPISLITASAGTYSGSKDVYFGAKADTTQASGTYMGTVVISVVTGTINENSGSDDYNPTTPTDPTNPNPNGGTPIYDPSGVGISTVTGGMPSSGATRYGGTTTYTTVSTSDGRTTTTTQVSGGDNRSSYAPAQGVIDRTTSVSEGSSLSSALAATATVAASSGVFFFILAKRRDDDEEEEENQ